MLRRVVGAAGPLRAGQRASSRTLSSFASFPYERDDDYATVFPNERYGCDYALNWSLNTDGVAPGGDAFGNLKEANLVMYSSGKVTRQRALLAAGAARTPVPSFATDVVEGSAVMDIEEYEGRRDEAKRELHERKRLFVEDAATGSYRTSEIKVRVITDSPELNLFARQMLVRVPLYDPDWFPRHIVVIANTQAAGEPFIVSDVDPKAPLSSKATVLASGAVPFAQIQAHIARCASQLALKGGYRHAHGGAAAFSARLEDGAEGNFLPVDRYWKADPAAPHPDLLVLPGDVLVNAKGEASAVFGAASQEVAAAVLAGAAAAPAAPAAPVAKGKKADALAAVGAAAATAAAPVAPLNPFALGLYASQSFVWDAANVSRSWAGVSVAAKALAPEQYPRHSIVADNTLSFGFTAPQALPAPKRVVVVGGKAADAGAVVEAARRAHGLSAEAADKLAARLAKTTIVAAANAAEAVKIARS